LLPDRCKAPSQQHRGKVVGGHLKSNIAWKGGGWHSLPNALQVATITTGAMNMQPLLQQVATPNFITRVTPPVECLPDSTLQALKALRHNGTCSRQCSVLGLHTSQQHMQ
jgi:hypothetical protein